MSQAEVSVSEEMNCFNLKQDSANLTDLLLGRPPRNKYVLHVKTGAERLTESDTGNERIY